MNFYGLETDRKGLVCDWERSPEYYLDILQKELGINTIRLPFSYEYINSGNIDKMEAFIQSTRARRIHIILDYHRTWMSHQGPSPEEGISMTDFINAWIHLLERFERYDNVFGVGIFNEIQHRDSDYTNKLHRRVISEIEKRFPQRFTYFAGCPNWGGDCENIDLSGMTTWNRTFIEVHKYHFSGSSDRHDWDISIPRRISADHWFIGETGWKQHIQSQREWAGRFLSYLKERGITNVCYWTVAHSGDTDGWFKDDCVTYDYEKSALSKMVWSSRHLRTNPRQCDNKQIPYDCSTHTVDGGVEEVHTVTVFTN
jgi:hypothetical protein